MFSGKQRWCARVSAAGLTIWSLVYLDYALRTLVPEVESLSSSTAVDYYRKGHVTLALCTVPDVVYDYGHVMIIIVDYACGVCICLIDLSHMQCEYTYCGDC